MLTFEELAAVGLAGGDLEGNDMALDKVSGRGIFGGAGKEARTCASFRSLIGIPIVDVMTAVWEEEEAVARL